MGGGHQGPPAVWPWTSWLGTEEMAGKSPRGQAAAPQEQGTKSLSDSCSAQSESLSQPLLGGACLLLLVDLEGFN